MDVIGFLCVSLGSSTVQLHDSLGNRRHVQGLVSVVKMATVLEECIAEKRRSVVRFLGGQKGLTTKYIHKKVSCLRWEVFVA
jgi:hypothetical protein